MELGHLIYWIKVHGQSAVQYILYKRLFLIQTHWVIIIENAKCKQDAQTESIGIISKKNIEGVRDSMNLWWKL